MDIVANMFTAVILSFVLICSVAQTSATCQKVHFDPVTNATFAIQALCKWYENSEAVFCPGYCTKSPECFAYGEQGAACFACMDANLNGSVQSMKPPTVQLNPNSAVLVKVDTDECADPSYCLNGGTCNDERFKIATCLCQPGFIGKYCDINIDECVNHTCQNGATCVDGVNGYTCSCVLGYGDTMCQANINDCSPNPCKNTGTCTDGLNSHTCSCPAWTSGTNCETQLYTVSNNGMSLSSAKSTCTGLSKKLAVIDDAAEAALLKSMFLSGAFDTPVANCMAVWVDGARIELYTVSNNGMSLSSAKSTCTGLSKKLAVIDDAAEAALLKSMFLSGAFDTPVANCMAVWVDGARIGGTWTWSDGSTNKWLQWGNGEPNNNEPSLCLTFAITPLAPPDRRFYMSDSDCNYSPPNPDMCSICE